MEHRSVSSMHQNLVSESSQTSRADAPLCFITPGKEMVETEERLSKSSIVGIVQEKDSSSWEKISAQDVKKAIIDQVGVQCPSLVVREWYPADFLIQVRSPLHEEIMKKGVIIGPHFSLLLKSWSRELFSDLLEYNVRVIIHVKGVPEHVACEDTVEELLKSYCTIERVSNRTWYQPHYRVQAWTSGIDAIPRYGRLAVPEPVFGTKFRDAYLGIGGCPTKMRTYPIEFETQLYESPSEEHNDSVVDSDYDYDSDREPKGW